MPSGIKIEEKYERSGWPSMPRPDLKPPQGWNLTLLTAVARVGTGPQGKKGEAIVIEYKGKQINCDDCPMRRKAEEKPKSLLGLFWHWHIKWCPGWKLYQEYLAGQQAQAS